MEEALSKKSNETNRQMVADEWNLGPEVASVEPNANGPFWSAMADRWMADEGEARRRFCANCEYFDNTPEAMKAMEAVPLDKFDMDGGGRGYCVKFDIICHSLRVCQAWERKDFEAPDTDEKWKFG